MKLPIKYKLWNNKLWVRYGLEDVWKVARENVKGNTSIPISQVFGNDFKWTKKDPANWYNKWFYKEILNIPGHNGIDFTAPTGTRLYAPHDGKITEIIHNDGNKGIRLKGKEYDSVFYHLKEWHCSLDQEVKEGDFIALTNNTGRYTTAPHLHWGVRPINWENNAYRGYIDFRGFIENLEVHKLPYDEGQCLLVKPHGKFYVVEQGDLVFYDSDKQSDRHIPIVDFFIKKNKEGLPPNFIKVINEEDLKVFNNLIK